MSLLDMEYMPSLDFNRPRHTIEELSIAPFAEVSIGDTTAAPLPDKILWPEYRTGLFFHQVGQYPFPVCGGYESYPLYEGTAVYIRQRGRQTRKITTDLT